MHNTRELRQRQPRIKDEAHLNRIRSLPCVNCFAAAPSEAAHVRYGDLAQGKPPTGIAEKPDDKWTLPLCDRCHRTGKNAQHSMNERIFWELRGINPIALCEALYAAGDNIEEVFHLHCFGKDWIW